MVRFNPVLWYEHFWYFQIQFFNSILLKFIIMIALFIDDILEHL